jgi:ADP-heptose:LPS heptosyltransferase
MTESAFKKILIHDLKLRFPNAIITQLDPTYIQGIPDILVLWKDKWAALECKASSKSSKRANQEYYVNLMNDMSFSAFIFPENKEAVLNEMERAFKGCS